MLEAIDKIEHITAKKLKWTYTEENRKGDHICYISDLTKFKSHYPNWKITIGVEEILRQLISNHTQRYLSRATCEGAAGHSGQDSNFQVFARLFARALLP